MAEAAEVATFEFDRAGLRRLVFDRLGFALGDLDAAVLDAFDLEAVVMIDGGDLEDDARVQGDVDLVRREFVLGGFDLDDLLG